MRRRHGNKRGFWDKEYKRGAHLALSTEPSEDLQKFLRWYEREYDKPMLSPHSSVLDLGCGNGRNLVFLSKEFGVKGAGIDTSHEAVAQAKQLSAGLPLSYEARSIAGTLPVPEASQDLVLDMMVSHFLKKEERANLYKEIARILKSDGWLFLKTFLLDEDRHAARLLREHPAEEAGSYVHPEFGGVEHVFTEDEIRADLAPYFEVEKITTSHRHLGRNAKRRSMSVYARKV